MSHFLLRVGDFFHFHPFLHGLWHRETFLIEDIEDVPARAVDRPVAPCDDDLARYSLSSEQSTAARRIGLDPFSREDEVAPRKPRDASWPEGRWL